VNTPKGSKENTTMNTQTQSIGEKMNERKAGAVAKVKALLWADAPDLDAIAAVALGAGLTPADVSQIETEVAGARALLSAADGVDVAELTRAHAAAVAAEGKASAAAERAVDAAGQARWRTIEAERLLSAGKLAVDQAAQACMGGGIPSGKITEAIRLSMAEQDEVQRATERRGKAGILRHGVIPKLRERLAVAEKLAENYKHMPTPTPSLEAEKAAALQSAKAARQRLMDAEAELVELLK
jgi:hypothetical protein